MDGVEMLNILLRDNKAIDATWLMQLLADSENGAREDQDGFVSELAAVARVENRAGQPAADASHATERSSAAVLRIGAIAMSKPRKLHAFAENAEETARREGSAKLLDMVALMG